MRREGLLKFLHPGRMKPEVNRGSLRTSEVLRRIVGLPAFLFLMAAFPVLFLYAHNIPQASLGDVLVPLAVAEATALLLFGILRLAYGDWHRAALGAAAVLLFLLTYGHVAQFLRDRFHLRDLLAGPVVLGAYVLVVAVALLGIARVRALSPKVTWLLNAIGATMVLLQIASSIGATVATRGRIPVLFDRPSIDADAVDSVGMGSMPRPDIYYIMLDRYAGRTALADVYGFDNSAFLSALKQRGFAVLEGSRCNYARTDMSLSSSLNLCYLNSTIETVNREALPRALYLWVQDNLLSQYLQARGYRHWHFGTWWYMTSRNRNADVNINRLVITEFSMMFYKTTAFYALGTVLGWDSQGDQYYRELYKFRELKRMWRWPSPKYVFVHFLLPHEGFEFDRNGRFQTRLAQSRRSVNLNYIEQLEFTNQKVLEVIDTLLANAPGKPVIILQADEGPRPGLNFMPTSEASTWHARYSILNAVLMPDAESLFHDVRTPVNTFRAVLNQLFGSGFPLLREASYDYTDGGLVDITTRLDSLGVRVRTALRDRVGDGLGDGVDTK